MKNHLHYCDNQTVIYPAGNYLVLHSLETGLQRFIPIYASDSSILTTGENNSDNNATVAAAAPKGASKQPQQEQQQQVERVPAGYQSTLMVMSADKRYVALVQRHPEDPHHYHHHGHGSSSGTIGSHNTVIQIFDCKKLRQHLLLRTTEPKVISALIVYCNSYMRIV